MNLYKIIQKYVWLKEINIDFICAKLMEWFSGFLRLSFVAKLPTYPFKDEVILNFF